MRRWTVYAAGFGVLWGLGDALLLGHGLWASVVRGTLGGLFFATVAIRRERRGLRKRPRARRR
jgi:hypothetical protein